MMASNNDKLENNNQSIIKYALHYGALLGIFWILKYCLWIFGVGYSDLFKYLFYIANVGTFLLVYGFTQSFRVSNPAKVKSGGQCILFAVLLCFFASFFEAVIMYAHYKFIAPEYFSLHITPVLKILDEMQPMGSVSEKDFLESKRIVHELFSMRITYIIGQFVNNIFLGLILGSVIALISGSRREQR